MNKSLILAAILGAAFTSCENESDNFGFQNQDENLISFSTPVVGTSSRAGLSELGYVPGKMVASWYNTDQDFNVFGIYSEKKGSSVTYIDNQLVKYNNSTDVAVWYTEQNYVWPKSGTMTFLAYSPAGAFKDNKENVTVEDKNLQIKDFIVPSEIDKQFDLMYTEAQDRNCEGSHETVQLPFKHALSSVAFTLSVTSGNLVAGEKTNAVLRSITLRNINNKGNFGKKGWEVDDKQKVDYNLFTGELALTNGTEWNTNKDKQQVLLLLPQERTYANGISSNQDAHLEIVWDLYGDNDVKLEQRSLVKLDTRTFNDKLHWGTERDQMQWKKGFAYTYNLTLNLDKIEVQGTLDEEQWTDFNDKDLDTSL